MHGGGPARSRGGAMPVGVPTSVPPHRAGAARGAARPSRPGHRSPALTPDRSVTARPTAPATWHGAVATGQNQEFDEGTAAAVREGRRDVCDITLVTRGGRRGSTPSAPAAWTSSRGRASRRGRPRPLRLQVGRHGRAPVPGPGMEWLHSGPAPSAPRCSGVRRARPGRPAALVGVLRWRARMPTSASPCPTSSGYYLVDRRLLRR